MKRYVPNGAAAENCDMETHRSKIRLLPTDDKTTEDDEESDEERLRIERRKKREEKEARRNKARDTEKESEDQSGSPEESKDDVKCRNCLLNAGGDSQSVWVQEARPSL